MRLAVFPALALALTVLWGAHPRDGTDAASSGGNSIAPVVGDADCSGVVDAVDALTVLRHTHGSAADDACVEQAEVTCNSVVNEDDAAAILKYVAQIAAASNCPPIGSLIEAPGLSGVRCEPNPVAAGEPVSCVAELFGGFNSTHWTAPGGSPDSGAGMPALSVVCPPGGVPGECQYSASSRFSTAFATAGVKTVTLEVCNLGACAAGRASVIVEGQGGPVIRPRARSRGGGRPRRRVIRRRPRPISRSRPAAR